MTKRRRQANPMFSKPLTTAEVTGMPKTIKRPFRVMFCQRCGGTSGTLAKVGDGKYVHQDINKCKEE